MLHFLRLLLRSLPLAHQQEEPSRRRRSVPLPTTSQLPTSVLCSMRFNNLFLGQHHYTVLMFTHQLYLALIAFLIASFLTHNIIERLVASTNNIYSSSPLPTSHATTTVVYIYSGNDPEYPNNLEYFLRNGIDASTAIYYLVLQQHSWPAHSKRCTCIIGCPNSTTTCPCFCPDTINQNLYYQVQLVYHENTCFDLGTYGDTFPHLTRTKYTIILNSSIRGPFLPSYYPITMSWTEAFTFRLSPSVKLVGTSINCGPTPHVQSFLLAMDGIGLEILTRAGVFICYATQAETVQKAEIKASSAILDAGYNIDCLLLRYQGIDWRLRQHHKCNQRRNPIPEHAYDGISIHPLETLFIKVKSRFKEWDNVHSALQYSAWRDDDHDRDITSNAYDKRQRRRSKKPTAPPKRCFNTSSYQEANYDLKHLSATALYSHYIRFGQDEARPGVQITC